MERRAFTVSHPIVKVLKKKLIESLDQIESETVRTTFAQDNQEFHRVIRENGGYIE